MKSTIYSDSFYKDRDKETIYSAQIVFKLLKEFNIKFKSVIDFGCGVGVFLNEAQKSGATEIIGVEGPWVPKEYLLINQKYFFEEKNLVKFQCKKKYDLAICLEVIEHLDSENADKMISLLISASDVILFSAAIPNQGGLGHVNEQWLTYWNTKFNENGFECIDIIRPEIWSDIKIPFWYRQNMVLFMRNEKVKSSEIKKFNFDSFNAFDMVHPDLYNQKLNHKSFLKKIFSNLKKN